MLLVAAGLLGAILGSFLNVVAWRLPRGESLVRPASRCPSCETPIRPWHNVPVLAWLALRGRCAACAAPIPVRYPLVEAATAALFVAVVAVTGADRDAVLGLVLVTALVPITLIDLDHRIIPNKITGPVAVVGLGLIVALDPGSLPERVGAAVIAGGAFLTIALIKPGGMGIGDVKLVALLGLFLGWAVAPAIFIALIAGSVAGAAIAAQSSVRAARKATVPFGPFLAAGGVAALLVGTQLIDWYSATFV